MTDAGWLGGVDPARRGLAILASLVAPILLLATQARAQSVQLERDEETETETLFVPYGFWNESLGLAAGAAFGFSGFLQPQTALIGTGYLSSNGSGALHLMGFDVQVPPLERLFLDPMVSYATYREVDAYVDGNPDFPDERAGSNDSSEDNFLQMRGEDLFFRLRFKYLLPIGHGADAPVHRYLVEDGLLAERPSGGESWDPFDSGRTYAELDYLHRRQDFRSDIADSDLETNSFRLGLRYDNRDFAPNPSSGGQLALGITRDFGMWGSNAPWTVVDAEASTFFDLGKCEGLRQSVLALGAWTANALTWDESTRRPQRPPLFAGARLGGLFRMRGFADSRFYDQAAIYYGAELRIIPDWAMPGPDSLLGPLELDWVQFVPFVEVGRVAHEWTLGELHSDMKWDAGLGLRASAKGLVVRVDIAFSEEDFCVQMMVMHPF